MYRSLLPIKHIVVILIYCNLLFSDNSLAVELILLRNLNLNQSVKILFGQIVFHQAHLIDLFYFPSPSEPELLLREVLRCPDNHNNLLFNNLLHLPLTPVNHFNSFITHLGEHLLQYLLLLLMCQFKQVHGCWVLTILKWR